MKLTKNENGTTNLSPANPNLCDITISKEKRMYNENDMLDFAWFMFENLGEWTDDREAHFKGMYLEKWKIFKNNQLFNEYKIGIDK